MPAANFDFILEQGTTFYLSLTMTKPDTLPFDLTGFTGRAQLRRRHSDDDIIIEFTVTIIDPPVNGIVSMSLTKDQTTLLDFIVGEYDLILTSDSGETYRILQGEVKFSPYVTR